MLGFDLQEEKSLVVIVHALVFPGEDRLRLSTVFVPFERLVVKVSPDTPKSDNERFTFEKVELLHIIFTTVQHWKRRQKGDRGGK